MLKKVAHFDDGSEINVDFSLFGPDLLKSLHDITETVNILCWFLDLESDLLDVILEVLHEGLSSLVKVLGVGLFPACNPLFESKLHVVGLQAESTNLVGIEDFADVFLKPGELDKLLFEVFKLWA